MTGPGLVAFTLSPRATVKSNYMVARDVCVYACVCVSRRVTRDALRGRQGSEECLWPCCPSPATIKAPLHQYPLHTHTAQLFFFFPTFSVNDSFSLSMPSPWICSFSLYYSSPPSIPSPAESKVSQGVTRRTSSDTVVCWIFINPVCIIKSDSVNAIPLWIDRCDSIIHTVHV